MNNRRAIHVSELTDEEIEAIRAAKPPLRAYFNWEATCLL